MRNCLHQREARKLDFSTLKTRRSSLYPSPAIHFPHLNSQEEQPDNLRRKSIKIYVLLFYNFLLFGITTLAQQKMTGVVTGTNGLPLEGATVAVKSTNIATSTIAGGSFSIAAKSGDILVISFIGYKSKQIEIGKETTLKITLSESVTNLDEIVLTGYTSQKVKEITGSVIVVKPKDLIAIPAGQLEQMFQGRGAGLNVITSGMPGSPSNVRLHGIGNFGDVTPLYIIDGVQGDINNLNPNDIESAQILKDAGAYSIYGVRGANGVFVITTRNGKPGKTKVSYDFYMGTTRPLKGIDVLNPQEMAELTWKALKNSGQTNPSDPFYGNGANPILPDYFIAGIYKGFAAGDPAVDPGSYNIDFALGPIKQIIQSNKQGTDWFHELFKPAFTHNHSMTVSGANEKNNYLLSIGYLNQQGTLLNTYLKKFILRINTSFFVNDHIRVGENLQLAYRDNPRIPLQQGLYTNEVLNDVFQAMVTQPILPVYDIKGGWAHFQLGYFDDNPAALRILAKDNRSQYWETFGNAYGEIDFLKNFTLRTSFGGSFTHYYLYKYTLVTYNSLANNLPNNTLDESSGYKRSWTWTNTLRFSKVIKNDHSIKALLGTEAIENYNREVGGRGIGFFSNDPLYRFLSNSSPADQTNYSFAGTSTLYSIISSIDYGFKEKYFLKATLRRDGSSIFGPRNRYGWFPSVSGAWRITEENFLKASDWLTDLKLRASWGKTGYYGNTDPFNQYTLYGGTVADAYYDIYGTNNTPVQGFRAIRIGDPNTGWQEDIIANAGFESILWNGKLNVTVDLYTKKASGLLFTVKLPDILGGAISPNINVGKVKNTGVDISVSSKGKFSKDCRWDAALTFTAYKSKILKLNDIPYFDPPFSNTGPIVRNEVGYPMGSFFGYKIIGIFKDAADVSNSPTQNSAAPGRFKYADINNDKVIDPSDRTHFGNPNPDFTMGLNVGINYKRIDLTTFFYGSFGNDVLNYPKLAMDIYSRRGNSVVISAKSKALLYDSWTPQNTNSTIPMAEPDFNFSNAGIHNLPTSYPMENGSYFRNKSLMLGYTLASTLLQKFKIEKMRVYVQALNLFTITKYTGLDPELSGRSDSFGIDFGNYPNNQKQFLLGVNVIF